MTHDHTPPKFMTTEEAERLFGGSYDGQCARCGSSIDWQRCEVCDGDGFVLTDDDEGNDAVETCATCDGESTWPVCISSYEWCEANPLEGREDVKRSTVEWFEVTS